MIEALFFFLWWGLPTDQHHEHFTEKFVSTCRCVFKMFIIVGLGLESMPYGLAVNPLYLYVLCLMSKFFV